MNTANLALEENAQDEASADDGGDVASVPAPSAVPVDLGDDGKQVGPTGTTCSELTLDPEAHVSMTAEPKSSEGGPWIISSGQTIAGG